MKKVLFAFLIVFLASCTSSAPEAEVPTTDSIVTAVDNNPGIKADTLAVDSCKADTLK